MVRRPTVIYPLLGSNVDLGFVRLAGHGLGNCFYTYFHAVVLAHRFQARLVVPPWFCLKIGPMLRGSHSKRLYFRMFRPFAGDIRGAHKAFTLLRHYRKRITLKVGDSRQPAVVPGALNLVTSSRFTFEGLHEHRLLIRERLLGIVKDPVPANHRWGDGGYCAMHVRLGDFADVTDLSRIHRGEPNLRIPLSWYVSVLDELHRQFPGRPVRLFSDGDERALAPLLERGAALYRSGSDITDLLAMSGASFLVGSNSTYSRWAAFLGDMPSLWLKTTSPLERPSSAETPLYFLSLSAEPPVSWT